VVRPLVWVAVLPAAFALGCAGPPVEPLKLEGNTLTVDNRSTEEWQGVEIWLNTYYRVAIPSIPAKGRFQTTLDNFVAGYGQRFDFRRMQVKDLRLTARQPDGRPLEIKKDFAVGGLGALKRQSARRPASQPGEVPMSRLKSELEVTCPCCQTTLVIDTNLGRVVSHKEPDRGDKPELTDAQKIVAAQAARREAAFQQSVDAEKTRGDALARRFEEALRQAKEEPVTKPMRDFDLD
jgi:hypothetical protein